VPNESVLLDAAPAEVDMPAQASHAPSIRDNYELSIISI
jgi:hypothetical protein